MRLEGKTALITGAAQGLGAAMAQRFALEGAQVSIADLPSQREHAERLIEEIRSQGGDARFFPLDVVIDEDWISALGAHIEWVGKLDILVNNAGINIREPIEEMSSDSLDAMLGVNVKGPFLGCKHAIPLLRKNGGGSIINMSSICGLVGHRYTTEAYTVTKGALTLLTKSIAVRYGKENIRCNSLHPSTAATALTEILFQDPQKKSERLAEVPLGRLATPQDIASAALFLASDEGSFLNGVALPVDGGLTAG
ncbi:MAG: SDR family oxidoreductase [Treponema sp.]|nr:SDR family oxidoreductase [Treponema sp.]